MSLAPTPTQPRRCQWCLSRLEPTNRGQSCVGCNSIDLIPEPTYAHALIGGEWAYDPKRGVQVWAPHKIGV